MQTTKALLISPVLVSGGSGFPYSAGYGMGAILFNEWTKRSWRSVMMMAIGGGYVGCVAVNLCLFGPVNQAVVAF